MTYHLEVDEISNTPVVVRELVCWRRQKRYGSPFKFLDYIKEIGQVISGQLPAKQYKWAEMTLNISDDLAVNTLGQLTENPRLVALRNFIIRKV